MASSTPVFSRPSASLFGVFEQTTNVSIEGPYYRYYPSQPIVEVSVPMSIEWGSTFFHGGQVSSAQSPRQPPQDLQGPSFHGNPFTFGGPFFPSYNQPSDNSGQSAVQPTQPEVQQGYSTGQTGQSYTISNQPNVQYNSISGQAAQPYGQPTVQYNQPFGQIGQPQIQSGQSTAQPTRPSGPSRQPSVAQPQLQPQQTQPSGQAFQLQHLQGYPSGQIAQSTGHPSGSAQPGFIPQGGNQAPSGLQMQGGVQPQPVYQPPLVPQTQFGLQSPYGYQQPQGQSMFTPYQNYQQPQPNPYGAPVGPFTNP